MLFPVVVALHAAMGIDVGRTTAGEGARQKNQTVSACYRAAIGRVQQLQPDYAWAIATVFRRVTSLGMLT